MLKIKKYEALDDRFTSFLENVRHDFVETEFNEEKKWERRKQADIDDLVFCKTYFPTIFSLPFNDMHRSMANLPPGMFTRSGFRKCGKSAIGYTAHIIKPIALGIGGICVISCETLEISKERTAAIKRLMLRNKLLCYDYGLELQQDLKGKYIINNTYLTAGSVEKGLRNVFDDEFKRIRRAVNDDLYSKQSVTSSLHNRKVVEFIEYEVAGQLEDDGISLTLANATSENAPIIELREKHPDNHFGMPALDENEKSTWPEYRTTREWIHFRDETEWDVWAGDYQDEPAVKGDIFEQDWLRPININTIKVVTSLSAADPAFGTSPHSCYKAIATVGLTNNNMVVVEDIYVRRESYFNFFDYIDSLRCKIPGWVVLQFENDFNQWHGAQPYYQDWSKQRQKVLPIVPHYTSTLKTEHRGSDKVSRIMNLVHPHQTGQIVYDSSIIGNADYKRYRSQYLSFGKAKDKLDGLDALATAFIMVRRYSERGSFKTLKTRQFQRVQTWFRRM